MVLHAMCNNMDTDLYEVNYKMTVIWSFTEPVISVFDTLAYED
jgi:hypothetical protein